MMRKFGSRLRKPLRALPSFAGFAGPIEALVDISAWIAAAWVALFMRFDFDPPAEFRDNVVRLVPIVVVVQLMVGLAIGLYRRRWRYGSFDEVAALVATSVLTTLLVAILNTQYFEPRLLPMSAVWFAGFVGLVLMAGTRYVWRLLLEQKKRPGADAARTIVFGAGDGGVQIINAMLRTPSSPFIPVAILDDDPLKRRLSIGGVRVVGGREEIASAASEHNAQYLLIAVPSVDGELLGQLTDAAEKAGLIVKVLPPVAEILDSGPTITDIRDLTEADLLGRHQIVLDLASIATYLSGRRVLVTGAGGSIGSELCRQIAQFGPKELLMLDRDESALHEVQLSITGRALLDTPDVILCDIRDRQAVEDIFRARKPHVVFHAAALKHLPMLEQYPMEAIKSNVLGTLNVLSAARVVDVERFVNISTDKAANPMSILGYSKRLAERLTSAESATATGLFLSVRFGNVLNSRGSVLTTFRDQIARGGPLTVTHPDVTRFFMTIPEAVQLVIQAAAIGRPAEVLVLDMGKAVKILDVAKRMIAQSGSQLKIEFTGLRPGEKIEEALFGHDEADERPFHKLISHAAVPPIDSACLVDEISQLTNQTARRWLAEKVVQPWQ